MDLRRQNAKPVEVLRHENARLYRGAVAAADLTHAQPPDEYATWPLNTNFPIWHMLFNWAPRTASTFQTATGTGLAILVLGLCGLVAEKASLALSPFAAAGRVSLALYSSQFVVVRILGLNGIESGLGEVPFGNLLAAHPASALSPASPNDKKTASVAKTEAVIQGE